MNVGERVRTLRQGRRLTLAALAGDELSVALVSKIERGLVSPSLSTLVYLASRLGVAPARLLEDEARRSGGSGAIAAARACLLLGDPATAAARAAEALGQNLPATMRARLLAVQAEALLAAGRTGEATAAVLQGSALVTPNEAGEDHVAAAELAWALGLLERRRGDRAAAHRSWVRCLERLEMLPSAEPSWPLLGARTQIELAALHEIDGALETAQHFLSRAAATLARLADPAMAAHDALAAGDALAAAGDAGRAIEVPVSPASALALAVVVAASRLAMQVGRDLARLERVASRWPAALAPVEVSHSRHLR